MGSLGGVLDDGMLDLRPFDAWTGQCQGHRLRKRIGGIGCGKAGRAQCERGEGQPAADIVQTEPKLCRNFPEAIHGVSGKAQHCLDRKAGCECETISWWDKSNGSDAQREPNGDGESEPHFGSDAADDGGSSCAPHRGTVYCVASGAVGGYLSIEFRCIRNRQSYRDRTGHDGSGFCR